MPTKLLLVQPASNPDSLLPLLQSWGFIVVCADSVTALADAMRQSDVPTLILINSASGDPSDLIDTVHSAPVADRAYVLLIAHHAPLAELIDCGADDIIAAPPDPDDLQLRLRNAQRYLRLTSELREAEIAYQIHALHDSLTRVLNHGAIMELLGRELERGRRSGWLVCVMMADLDLFKQVNDTRGHQCGDDAIIAVANRIQSQLRHYDGVGRYGGDEFLIVLSGCALPQALEIAERIRVAVSATPIETPGTPLSISISIGLAGGLPASPPVDAVQLVRLADTALFQAKRDGRNRVVTAT